VEDACRAIDLEGSLASAMAGMLESGVRISDSETVLGG
jgi:hypothetical protein